MLDWKKIISLPKRNTLREVFQWLVHNNALLSLEKLKDQQVSKLLLQSL
jgi:hypothetical protein